MTLGKGSIIDTSHKQKINTRSSTEAELVGADNAVIQIQWAQLFVEAQGYPCRTVLHQDNEAAMRLELNGKRSSSKRTRHLNIRYFYITDQIDQGWLSVRHCGTDDMIGDFFTKPLQGIKFRTLRALVMNCPVDIPPEYMPAPDADATPTPDTDTGVCWRNAPRSPPHAHAADPNPAPIPEGPRTRGPLTGPATCHVPATSGPGRTLNPLSSGSTRTRPPATHRISNPVFTGFTHLRRLARHINQC